MSLPCNGKLHAILEYVVVKLKGDAVDKREMLSELMSEYFRPFIVAYTPTGYQVMYVD